MEKFIEEIAKIIDPDAFGLSSPYVGENWLTDRDEAREKAKVSISLICNFTLEKAQEAIADCEFKTVADCSPKGAQFDAIEALEKLKSSPKPVRLIDKNGEELTPRQLVNTLKNKVEDHQ